MSLKEFVNTIWTTEVTPEQLSDFLYTFTVILGVVPLILIAVILIPYWLKSLVRRIYSGNTKS